VVRDADVVRGVRVVRDVEVVRVRVVRVEVVRGVARYMWMRGTVLEHHPALVPMGPMGTHL